MNGRRKAAALLPAVLVLLWAPVPARAHPFGPPPTAQVSASGHTVRIVWRAAPDDVAALGVRLGLVGPGAGPEQAADVAGRQPLRTYALEHMQVLQDSRRCAGAVGAGADPASSGIHVRYRCPAPVARVDLRMTMLHDLHPAYRTFAHAVEGWPSRAVFTSAAARRSYDFSAGAGTRAGVSLSLQAAGALAAAAVAAAAAVRIRRRQARGR